MADIDSILAGIGGNTRADFSGIGDLPKAYWEGKNQRFENDKREAFKPTAENPNGIPMKDGQPDIAAMAKIFFQKGDFATGTALLGQAQNATERTDYANDGQPKQPPQSRMSVTDAPSPSRSIQGQAAPELSKGGVQGPGQSPQGGFTTTSYLAAAGIPNSEIEKQATSLSNQLGISPTYVIDTNDPRIRNVIVPAVQQMKRMGIGQVQPPQPGDNQPQQVPQAQVAQAPQMAPQGFQPSPAQQAAQNDPELKRLRFRAGSPDKAVAESGRMELKTYLEGKQPTTEMKNAAGQGVSLRESLDRTDENTTQRDILTKSIIPRIDKSQETATAARDDIDAIHRARGELDRKGGVFSGAYADQKLYMAKVAELLGIKDADRIPNTEAYGAAIGSRVASMVKAFGSGTAISDGDRKFAAAMAGGEKTLDESSMRRILDIGEKAARGKIDYHNQFVKKAVDANEGLKPASDSFVVKAPGQYQKPEASAAFPKFNSASDVQAAIASKKLKSGDAFLTSDGRTKYVP